MYRIQSEFTNLLGDGILTRHRGMPGSEMITDVESRSELPQQFSLEQNFPNPFNPSTNIKYEIPSTGHVALRVFDMLGREVAALVNEQKQPGTYTVEWDASGMASGVYLYRLHAGGLVETKKAVVLK